VRLQAELHILKHNIKQIFLKNHNIMVWTGYIWLVFAGPVVGYCELSDCPV
jgi:hypothetical protein